MTTNHRDDEPAGTCTFCAVGINYRDAEGLWVGGVNANHWTGDRYVRLDACQACYLAGRFAKAPRAPRRPRRPRPALYGDFATIAAINGIRTDGTGRRIR